jgi:hypothetical protein
LDYGNPRRTRFSRSSPNLATHSTSSEPQTVIIKWVFKLKDTIPLLSKSTPCCSWIHPNSGEDYDDIYDPVVKASSIRTVFALATQEDLLIFHLENILIEIPPGFIFPPQFTLPDGLTIDDFVLQLNKALYGLKQASNVWATIFQT